jgi:hypothetical protein
LVTGAKDKEALLFISDEFLSGFTREDNINVGGAPLAPDWRSRWPKATQVVGGYVLGYNGVAINGFRCGVVKETAVDEAIRQLREAQQYARSFTVKVHRLI